MLMFSGVKFEATWYLRFNYPQNKHFRLKWEDDLLDFFFFVATFYVFSRFVYKCDTFYTLISCQAKFRLSLDLKPAITLSCLFIRNVG